MIVLLRNYPQIAPLRWFINRRKSMLRTVVFSFAVIVTAAVASAQGNVRVDGYTRKDGTYVQPHYRTAPDNSRTNNYGSQGNVNPYTGQQGTANPYQQPTTPNYNSGFGNTNRDRRY